MVSSISGSVCVFLLCACILSNKSFFANPFWLMRDVAYRLRSMLVIHTSSRIFRAFWCSLYLFSWWLLTLWWPNEYTWSSGGRVSYYQTRQSCPASNYVYASCVFQALQENETRIAHVRISIKKNWSSQFIAHNNARGMFKNIPMGDV